MAANITLLPEQLAENKGGEVLGVSITMTVLAALAVGLRLLSRHLVSSRLWWDDYMMIVALILAFGGLANLIAGIEFGLARHVETVTPSDLVKYLQTFYADEILYTLVILSIKISILLMYHRIFATPHFRLIVKIVLAISLGWGLSATLVSVFGCIPPAKFWVQNLDGNCVHLSTFYIASAAINIATDIIIVILPIALVWKLQMARGQKLALCAIFALASFVCVASIVRISVLNQTNFVDSTWVVQPAMWTIIEPCTGIISACLPSMRPLYSKTIREYASTLGRNNAGSHPSSYNASKRGSYPQPMNQISSSKNRSSLARMSHLSDDPRVMNPTSKRASCNTAGGVGRGGQLQLPPNVITIDTGITIELEESDGTERHAVH